MQIDLSKPIMKAQSEPATNSNIAFYTGGDEILRVASDGFYVRGKPLPIDDEEAMAVYKAFRTFLVYHGLTAN